MYARVIGLAAGLLAAAATSGCQTVGDQAPVELQEAERSVKSARAADMEDFMPSALEAAERRLETSVERLDAAASLTRDGKADQAQAAQASALKAAGEAKLIADSGRKLLSDMRAFDERSYVYLSVADQKAQADSQQAALQALKTRNAQLEQQLATAKQPVTVVEDKSLADFRVGKPVAFFATNSTKLAPKYRADIEELANLIKKHDDLHVKLEGFADPRGSAERNKELAGARLKAVADQLAEFGVAQDRVELVTVGADAAGSKRNGDGQLQLDRKVTATLTTAH